MKQLLIFSFILFFVLLFGCNVEVDDSDQSTAEQDREYTIDPEADKLLKQMSDNLSSTEEFTVRVQSSSDFTNNTGEIIKLHRGLTINLKRPDKIMVDTQGDIGYKQLFYNGTEAVLYHLNHGMYSIVKAPGTVDETLDMLAEDYDFQIPASDIAYSDPYSYLMEEVKGAKYYGESSINGVPCHHLYFTQDEIDWQIWLDVNDQHTPIKFIINFKNDEGSPQFTAYFYDWNFSPSLSDDIFSFNPPEGTKQIEFMKVEKNSK
jgi:hypothetical protein